MVSKLAHYRDFYETPGKVISTDLMPFPQRINSRSDKNFEEFIYSLKIKQKKNVTGDS